MAQAATVHSEQGTTLQDLPLELVHHILNLVWPDKRQPRSCKVEVCSSLLEVLHRAMLCRDTGCRMTIC